MGEIHNTQFFKAVQENKMDVSQVLEQDPWSRASLPMISQRRWLPCRSSARIFICPYRVAVMKP